jgi:hypothetical protein
MKKHIFYIGLLLGSTALFSQECPTNESNSACCNGVISTDPRNGGTQNLERPNITHKFNWMTQSFPTYYPPLFTNNGNNYELANPFFNCEDSYLSHISLYNYRDACHQPLDVSRLDFHPEFGWELLHRQTGLELDELTRVPMGTSNRSWPYLILYNKYTGKVRVIGGGKQGGEAQNVVVKMGFPLLPSGEKKYDNVSAMLSEMNNSAQTLDSWSKSTSVSMATAYPKIPGSFVVDFTVGYDPCACGRKPDDLTFEFSSLTEADISMQGRMLATNVPLNGSGNSPLLNRKDFLLAVNTDGWNVKGGAQMYANIDGLVTKYKAQPQSLIEKWTIEGFKAGAAGGLNALSGGIFTGLRNLYCNNPNDWHGIAETVGFINGNGDPAGLLKDGKLGAGTIASGADFLAGLLFGKPQAVPNITFIEGELVLKGTMKSNTPEYSNSIRLAHPGSLSGNAKNTDGSFKYLNKNYPFYNEALGIVSFLKQPKAYMMHEKSLINHYDGLNSPVGAALSEVFKVQLNGNLEYYFNPILDVDLEKTKIVAAFVMDVDKEGVSTGLPEPLAFRNKVGAFNRVVDSKDTTVVTYITDFFPLDCFSQMSATFERDEQIITNVTLPSGLMNPRNLKLRLFLDIHYKKNKYGQENRHNLIYTFPLVTEKLTYTQVPTGGWYVDENGFVQEATKTVTSPELAKLLAADKMQTYPMVELLPEGRNFAQNTEIKAWDKIIIAGNITVNAGVTVKLIAKEIIVAQGVTVPIGVELIATNLNPIGCTDKIQPVSSNSMKVFCNSDNYKANNSLTLSRLIENPSDTVAVTKLFLKLYPNPFNNELIIDFAITELSNVSISLSNSIGQLIKTIELSEQAAGNHQQVIMTTDIAPGVYYLTLQTKFGVETKKIVKQL